MSGEPLINIVDDDASIRAALRRLFVSAGLHSRGFRSAAEFLAAAPHHGPQCILLDIRMPGTTGLDLQAELNARNVDIPIIFVTALVDVPTTVRAMKAGAVELLTKPFDERLLLDAVRDALEHSRQGLETSRELDVLRQRLETLTAREREVMVHVVHGLLNKQVAAALGTSEKTIKVHRARVMHKMGATSLAQLVRMADRLGLTAQEQLEPESSGAPRRTSSH